MRIKTHSGEMLLEEFLKPLDMSATQLAEEIGVPPNRITDIIRGRRGVTADTALRFGRYFDISPEFWMGLQAGYDLSIAQSETDYSEIKVRA